MKYSTIFFQLFCMFLLFGCTTPSKSDPQPKPEETLPPQATEQPSTTEQPSVTPEAEIIEEDVIIRFDTVTITKQKYQSTKSEIEAIVEDLNKITFSRDYTRWISYLSEGYIAMYSNPAILERVSANLPTKGIKLQNLADYFRYVFVPSRQNMRVDEIQFVSPTRVYVIMEIAPGSSAAIYILEKDTSGWKIIDKNQ